MAENPFTFGGMITDPDRFIGRRAEREQIVARLLTRDIVERVEGGIRFEVELTRR